MLDTPCYGVVRGILATHFIRQFPFQFPSLRHRLPSRFNWSLQHYWQHEYSMLPVPQIWRPLHNRRPPPLPNGGPASAASRMQGKFDEPRQQTAGFHQLIRPCRGQWHLHKHTKSVALNSQNWGTHKIWTSSDIQLIHWKIFFHRLSCNLHLGTSDFSLYPTTIFILTHAPLIESSKT